MRVLTFAPVLLIVALLAGSAYAQGPSAPESRPAVSKEEVVAFVDKMVAHIDEVGPERAFADFSDTKGPWIQGELYPFCHNLAGINVAHGGNPNMVGKGGVLDIRDPDGRYVNRLIFDKVLADGKGWVEYKWPNSLTKKIEMKDVYSVLVRGKYICGSGRYRPGPPTGGKAE